MPSRKYCEIYIGDAIETIPDSFGLWHDHIEMHSYINWRNIKTIARRNLTPTQYRVFVLYGERGMKQRELGIVFDVSGQSSGRMLGRSIKKIRKIFEKWFQNGDIYRGGFKEHTRRERLLKKGLYNEEEVRRYMREM